MKMNALSTRLSCAAILSAVALLGTSTIRIARAQTQAAAGNATQDPKDLTGQWQGTVEAPAQSAGQRVVFQVSKADSGGWKTVFNYIDLIAQGSGIPRSANLTLRGSTVEIAVPGNDGKYEGELSPDGKSIAGTWTQGSTGGKLNLTRATPDIAWEVPKPPPPPKPMPPDADPAFDVATIKPNASGGGGQGIRHPGTNLQHD